MGAKLCIPQIRWLRPEGCRPAPHLAGEQRGRRAPAAVTDGAASEWSPVVVAGGMAYLRGDAKRPARAVVQFGAGGPRELAPETVPAEFPTERPGGAAAGDLHRHGRHAGPRAALSAARRRGGGETPRAGLLPRRLAAADAARLALHGLLQQRLRDESVPGQPGLRRAVGQLPQRHRLRARISARRSTYGAAGASEFNDVLGAGLYLRTARRR